MSVLHSSRRRAASRSHMQGRRLLPAPEGHDYRLARKRNFGNLSCFPRCSGVVALVIDSAGKIIRSRAKLEIQEVIAARLIAPRPSPLLGQSQYRPHARDSQHWSCLSTRVVEKLETMRRVAHCLEFLGIKMV